jgi:hypothetical protein
MVCKLPHNKEVELHERGPMRARVPEWNSGGEKVLSYTGDALLPGLANVQHGGTPRCTVEYVFLAYQQERI